MKTAIIDCGSGNLRSVSKAFEHLGADCTVTNSTEEVKSSGRIVLPGVGAFADVKAGLKDIDGMVETLTEQVLGNKKPFLGICVGMQLLADVGLEYGEHQGFGWIKGRVEPIPQTGELKIPHMGWNSLEMKEHTIFKDIEQASDSYFVHSYHMVCEDESDIIATTDYGQKITAAVAKDNIIGLQFHPEKSQKTGLQILANFLKI